MNIGKENRADSALSLLQRQNRADSLVINKTFWGILIDTNLLQLILTVMQMTGSFQNM
jgi:hypothetical protein